MLIYLIKQSRVLLLNAVFFSVLAGVSSVLIVTQINAALTAEESARQTMALIFAVTAVAVILSQMISSVLFERLAQRAYAESRRFAQWTV